MANDAHEEFWGCTLSKDKKEYTWDPHVESEDDVEHKLQLTSACLGHKAKDKERNLIEVTTEDDDGKKITCPVVSLRIGGKECIHLDLGFGNTTKFTLKEGSGPLALCGVHLQAIQLDFDESGSSSEDEEVPDLVSVKPGKKENKSVPQPEQKSVKKPELKKETKEAAPSLAKRPLAGKKEDGPAKKKKLAAEESDEESGDDDEYMEGESGEEEESDEEEMPSLLDGEAEEVSDEDSEEGDEDELEGDDVDSDEDDEEEGDSDDEESDDEKELKPSKKDNKKTVNGHGPKSTPAKGGNKDNKDKSQKTPTNKKTPGKNEQTPKSQAKKTPEELKAHLLKSPNLPKKFDKFANFMKNNMKVVDVKTQKELWDYVQKNKK